MFQFFWEKFVYYSELRTTFLRSINSFCIGGIRVEDNPRIIGGKFFWCLPSQNFWVQRRVSQTFDFWTIRKLWYTSTIKYHQFDQLLKLDQFDVSCLLMKKRKITTKFGLCTNKAPNRNYTKQAMNDHRRPARNSQNDSWNVALSFE